MNSSFTTARSPDTTGHNKNRRANSMHQGTIIAALRRICGMTQDDLAAEVGVSRRTIATLETNPQHALEEATAERLSAAFLRRGIVYIDRGDAITLTIPKSAISPAGKAKG